MLVLLFFPPSSPSPLFLSDRNEYVDHLTGNHKHSTTPSISLTIWADFRSDILQNVSSLLFQFIFFKFASSEFLSHNTEFHYESRRCLLKKKGEKILQWRIKKINGKIPHSLGLVRLGRVTTSLWLRSVRTPWPHCCICCDSCPARHTEPAFFLSMSKGERKTKEDNSKGTLVKVKDY